MKLGYYVWIMAGTSAAYIQPAPYEAAEAYIQPASYRTDETVKSELNRLSQPVDDTQIPISGQSYIRHP